MRKAFLAMLLALAPVLAGAGASPKDLPLLRKMNGKYHLYEGMKGFRFVAKPELSEELKAALERLGAGSTYDLVSEVRYPAVYDRGKGPKVKFRLPEGKAEMMFEPFNRIMGNYVRVLLEYALAILWTTTEGPIFSEADLRSCKFKVERLEGGYRVIQDDPDGTMDLVFKDSLVLLSRTYRWRGKGGEISPKLYEFRETPKGLILGEVRSRAGKGPAFRFTYGYSVVEGHLLPDRIWVETESYDESGLPLGLYFQLYGHRLNALDWEDEMEGNGSIPDPGK
jgi:hypothetical protein